MATYTLRQYQALINARATGVQDITIEGRRTTWRSLAELDLLIATIKADLEGSGILEPATVPATTRIRLRFSKGL